MTPAEQQIIDEAARLRRENDELRAENKRLAAAYQHVVDESARRELEKTTSAADWQERMDAVRNRELEGLRAELAAAKRREARTWQDANELRQRISDRRFELVAEQDYNGAAAVRGILDILNELETFREVK